jgi:hypothetical protein
MVSTVDVLVVAFGMYTVYIRPLSVRDGTNHAQVEGPLSGPAETGHYVTFSSTDVLVDGRSGGSVTTCP